MDNPRPEKVAVVDEVREHFDTSDAAILTEYRGLKVKDLATLRRALRPSGGEYKVYKNTLVTLAARESGLAELEPLLKGPTAIAFVKGDAAAVAKALRDYSRTNPTLVIKGGVLGDKIIGAPETTALAELPSREVLLAQLAGAMAAPLQQFAGLLQALPRNLAYGLAALRDKREAEGPSTGAAPAAAADDTAAAPVAVAAAAPAAAPAAAADDSPAVDEAPTEEAAAEPAPAAEAAGETDTTTEPTEPTE